MYIFSTREFFLTIEIIILWKKKSAAFSQNGIQHFLEMTRQFWHATHPNGQEEVREMENNWSEKYQWKLFFDEVELVGEERRCHRIFSRDEGNR